jgi:hypothetical protein
MPTPDLGCTEAGEMPISAAMSRTVQWVASPGGGASVTQGEAEKPAEVPVPAVPIKKSIGTDYLMLNWSSSCAQLPDVAARELHGSCWCCRWGRGGCRGSRLPAEPDLLGQDRALRRVGRRDHGIGTAYPDRRCAQANDDRYSPANAGHQAMFECRTPSHVRAGLNLSARPAATTHAAFGTAKLA